MIEHLPITEAKRYKYVLITPARNEEKYIRKTIESVISQTIIPEKWIIVSDGSTDKTDDIVKEYLKNKPWIELVRMRENGDRSFAAKVFCFNIGYRRLKTVKYDIIGNLDADLSFDQDYMEFLLNKFAKWPQLGVAGTPFIEDSSSTYDYRYSNIEHVSGACQLFRRQCFEEIGGYIPIKAGGIDWVAVTTARMRGWNTRTFAEKVCFHHRKMGSSKVSTWVIGFKHGEKDYCLGGHPLWQIFRCFYQMTRKPYIILGATIFVGYIWAWIKRSHQPVNSELRNFHRKEQVVRLKRILSEKGKL